MTVISVVFNVAVHARNIIASIVLIEVLFQEIVVLLVEYNA